MKTLYLSAAFLLLSQIAFSQYQIGLVPRVSPDKAVFQKIGYTEVEVRYGSPAVQERQIWGDLVPYDKVWRAGANNATTLSVSAPIVIEETVLDSGQYALFILPRENEKWELILNKVAKQWGAFRHDPAQDVLRVEVLPRAATCYHEDLAYSLSQRGYNFGTLSMNWGALQLDLDFEVNYLEQFEKEVESRVAKQPDNLKWVVYLQGAEHLENINAAPVLAENWINKSEQAVDLVQEWNEQFYPLEYIRGHLFLTKAKILAKAEKYQEALSYIERLKALEDPIFYNKEKEEEGIDALVSKWSKM